MWLPEKLTPIEGLDRSLLPSWIEDVGLLPPMEGLDRPVAAMIARGPNDLHHVDFLMDEPIPINDTFWMRYAEPAVNCLGAALFDAEHPGKTIPSFHWEALARLGEPITEEQQAIIARRKELTWTSPIRVFPDQD